MFECFDNNIGFKQGCPLSPTLCYATNSQNRIKYRSTTSKLAYLRGQPPLHYTNEQFLNDSNDKTFFLYIGV